MGIKPITTVISKRGETALHIATAANHTHFVKNLVDMIAEEKKDLAIKTKTPIAPQASSPGDKPPTAPQASSLGDKPPIAPQASSLGDAMATAATAFKIAEDPTIGPKSTAAALTSAIGNAPQQQDPAPQQQDPAPEPEEHENTSFCYAALSGNVKIAQIMKKKKHDLSVIRGGKNLFPVHIAALAGHAQMVRELYEEYHIKNQLKANDCISLLIALVESDIYMEVKVVVRPGQIVAKNKQKQTAREVFMKKHENLRIAAEKWMIKAANSCMLVATLIATVTFAAAFTLPGGNRQDNGPDNGFPVFVNRTLFKILP
ncbi:hypothetical protein GH714_006442 [Hevea brasiliensis]|uniref:PGG domain-containing protein n=1 Tax=Hevea brasiliensis TaxID=3981 RepID=A0A6A6MCD0_HEVBR|nr:hypothetical protein GH714_006442 [Hevea brasiliensis]